MDFGSLIHQEDIYSVSELTNEIKILLETGIPPVWVQGELSNFVHHSSGHMYFSLKDRDSQISCVMWRSRNAAMFFTPQDGMKVNALGQVRVYEKRGNYQLDIVKMMPSGVGELQLAFDQLKSRLQEEGLFDQQYKKAIPEFPEKIGVITSPTGAVIRDIVNVVNRRFPAVELILRPVRVQGEGASLEIAEAVREMNEYNKVDVIIIARGGGSLEDLWAFNEEVTARAVFQSEIPVVSAVGHEIDFTICDFVADLRAPTPSAAAELVVPDKQELLQRIQAIQEGHYQILNNRLAAYGKQLEYLNEHYGFKRISDRIRQYNQQIDELLYKINTIIVNRLNNKQEKIVQLFKRLQGLHPQSILKRGFSICFSEKDGTIIRDASDLAPNDKISIDFSSGHAKAQVSEISTKHFSILKK